MFQAESLFHKKITDDPYLFTNLVFGFFPISFILGSLIVNLNLSLICILGIYHLKSKILTTKINFALKNIWNVIFYTYTHSTNETVKQFSENRLLDHMAGTHIDMGVNLVCYVKLRKHIMWNFVCFIFSKFTQKQNKKHLK